MTTFIMRGRFTTTAVKKISGGRTEEAKKIIAQAGGTLVSGYATLGDIDVLLIAEFPGLSEAMKASTALTEALDIAFATVPALDVNTFDKLVGHGA